MKTHSSGPILARSDIREAMARPTVRMTCHRSTSHRVAEEDGVAAASVSELLLKLLRGVLCAAAAASLLGCQAGDSLEVGDLTSRAERGDKDAQFQLGVRFERGDGVPTDPAKAVAWYKKAADAGHLGAAKNLA